MTYLISFFIGILIPITWILSFKLYTLLDLLIEEKRRDIAPFEKVFGKKGK